LRVEFSDANHTRCEFARTEPAQDTEVPRKSTVVIVAGSQLCTPPSSDDPPPSSSEAPPSSSEAPPSSSEAPPSSSEAPPDSSSGDLPTSSS
jgi:beta-lactam-binding protein with PASTA domain